MMISAFSLALILLIAFAVWGIRANIKLYKDNPYLQKISDIKEEIELLESTMTHEEQYEYLRMYQIMLMNRMKE